MKILPVSIFRPVQPVQIQSRTVVSFCGGNNKDDYDTFRRSSDVNNPAQERTNIFKQVIENPELKQRVMELIAYAASVIVMGSEEKNPKPVKGSDKINGIIKDALSQEAPPENSEEAVEPSQAKEVKEERDKYLEEVEESETVSEEILETSGEEKKLVKIEFPRRRGRLSKANEKLKAAVSEMVVTPETAEKAEFILQNLLNNKTNSYNGEKIKSDTLANILLSNLSIAENRQQKEQVINDFFEQLNIKTEEKTDININMEEQPQIISDTSEVPEDTEVLVTLEFPNIKDLTEKRKFLNEKLKSDKKAQEAEILLHSKENVERLKRAKNLSDEKIEAFKKALNTAIIPDEEREEINSELGPLNKEISLLQNNQVSKLIPVISGLRVSSETAEKIKELIYSPNNTKFLYIDDNGKEQSYSKNKLTGQINYRLTKSAGIEEQQYFLKDFFKHVVIPERKEN